MPTTKVQISLWATPDELAKLEDIKQAAERNTQADTLRMLINWGHKFFCSKMSLLRIDNYAPVRGHGR